MEQRIFPLDEKLKLLKGGYSPQVQETITRLGSRMSYGEAEEEIRLLWGIEICKATVCNTTMRYGHHTLAATEAETAKLETERTQPTAEPNQLVVSVDGAMVQLTTGDWHEVKLAAIGEFEAQVKPKNSDVKAKTDSISYFARMTQAAEFERAALLEWHKRGGENAKRVVAVNDGARWIQSFVDYHCPKAIRVLDFAHAQGALTVIGKAAYGEGDIFRGWFTTMSKQLGTQPPQRTLNQLRLLQRQQSDETVQTEMDNAIRYLETRQSMIDYPHFRNIQIPIGSGISESGHRVVMQRRMKQAGMRWAKHNVNAMLALRTALCNKQWHTQWQATCQYARRPKKRRSPERTTHIDETPVTEADCQRLQKLIRKPKKKGWQNHHYIFPHRPKSLHRT